MEIINETQLASLMGYVRIGDVERKLIEQGIRPIYGRNGHFFVTREMINAARGIAHGDVAGTQESIEDLI